MRQYKMLFIGLIAGAILATAGTSFAESAIQEVKAYLRPDFTIQMDGKKAELTNTPLIYEGSSYLPVREIAGLLGKEVDFKDNTILLNTKEVATMEFMTLRDLAVRDKINMLVFKNVDFKVTSTNQDNPSIIDTGYGLLRAFNSQDSLMVNIDDWNNVITGLPKN